MVPVHHRWELASCQWPGNGFAQDVPGALGLQIGKCLSPGHQGDRASVELGQKHPGGANVSRLRNATLVQRRSGTSAIQHYDGLGAHGIIDDPLLRQHPVRIRLVCPPRVIATTRSMGGRRGSGDPLNKNGALSMSSYPR